MTDSLNSNLKVFRVLHAGYLLNCGNTQILFDPIFENPFSVNCYAFPEIEFQIEEIKNLKPDAVFISHYHDDHCSLKSFAILDRKIPIFIFCLVDSVVESIQALGFQTVTRIKLDTTYQFGKMKIKALKALDEDVDSLFHIECDQVNILNVVDSWIHPETLVNLQKVCWDLILWPFQYMREVEVIAPSVAQPAEQGLLPEFKEQLKILNPKSIVPSSCQFQFEKWSWYNLAFFPVSYLRFKEEIFEILPHAQCIRMDPGESIEYTGGEWKNGRNLPWIVRKNKELVDYVYDPLVTPQPISEVAKYFPELSLEEKQQVRNFLKRISHSGNWLLRIYDHQGQSENYFFGERSEKDIWTTEILEFKLFQALFHNEQLTSLYLRVTPNDRNSDPMLDPLIGSLYSREF